MIGAIHGNERAGIAIVRRLAHDAGSRHVRLWVVPEPQPGRRPRQHARQRPRRRPQPQLRLALAAAHRARAPTFYAGPAPLSEPESRFARLLIARLRPDITIWFHQSETAVDISGGSTTIEARFARRVALPLRKPDPLPGQRDDLADASLPEGDGVRRRAAARERSAHARRARTREQCSRSRGADRMLASKQLLETRWQVRRRRWSARRSSGCAWRSASRPATCVRLRPAKASRPTELSILATITRRGSLRLTELAEIERVNPTMLSRIAGRLAEARADQPRGRRRRPPRGARRGDAAGVALHERIRAERSASLAAHLDELSDDDVHALLAALPALEALAEGLRRDAPGPHAGSRT